MPAIPAPPAEACAAPAAGAGACPGPGGGCGLIRTRRLPAWFGSWLALILLAAQLAASTAPAYRHDPLAGASRVETAHVFLGTAQIGEARRDAGSFRLPETDNFKKAPHHPRALPATGPGIVSGRTIAYFQGRLKALSGDIRGDRKVLPLGARAPPSKA